MPSQSEIEAALFKQLLSQGLEPKGTPIDPMLQGFGELGGLQRPGGGMSTELGITVTNPLLNEGLPTNIPTLVNGQENMRPLLTGSFPTREQEGIAVQRAIERSKGPFGIDWPSYDSIQEAEQASMRHSSKKDKYNEK